MKSKKMSIAKKGFDLIFATSALAIFTIPMFVISIAILMIDGWPIIFTQKRLGKDCKPFKIIKFRTMNPVHHTNKGVPPEEARISKCGRLLRETSLDEIPSFLNVINGEMSIVGPRPLLPEYESLYSAKQIGRQRVKPGITGLAQISGRNQITWSSKFRLDLLYVKKSNFCLDSKIILITALRVITRNGVNSKNGNPPTAFKGH